MKEILVIDDSEADIYLIIEAFISCNIKLKKIRVAKDAERAEEEIEKLKNLNNSNPLVLLDLNIPKGGGFRILKLLKEVEETREWPVIIFSNSKNPEDIKRSYLKHANCYIVKPFDFDNLKIVVSNINDFWFSIVKYSEDKE